MKKFNVNDTAFISGFYFGSREEAEVIVLAHDFEPEIGWYYEVVRLDEYCLCNTAWEIVTVPENRLYAKPRSIELKERIKFDEQIRKIDND